MIDERSILQSYNNTKDRKLFIQSYKENHETYIL